MGIERLIGNEILEDLEKEIEDLIKNKTSDKNKIELTLAYLMHPSLEKQFNKLVNYYKTIDEKSAKEYLEIYNNLF